MYPKRIIVTGASGFIGRHLIKLMAEYPGINAIPLSRKTIPGYFTVPGYIDPPDGEILIHLAENNNANSMGLLDRSYEKTLTHTINSFFNKKYEKIIYISSSMLYGDSSMSAHGTEDEIFLDTRYCELKYLAECCVLNSSSGLVARLSNVYGKGMSKSNVISHISNQIQNSGDLKIQNDAPVRDFINVRDVVEGIFAIAMSDSIDKRSSKVYNIGTGVGTSIGELAKLMLEKSGQAERNIVSVGINNMKSTIILDYSKMFKDFGWKPQIPLADGITELFKIDPSEKSE